MDVSHEETGGQRSLLSSRSWWMEGGREWVGRSLTDHVSDDEVHFGDAPLAEADGKTRLDLFLWSS
jgi:hypothetical protein